MSGYHYVDYSDSVENWLKSSYYEVDCEEKRKALISLFDKSAVAFIYGSAGTGKSTLINHISHFFNHEKKLYLANTNPAVDNLKRKVDAPNGTFQTMAKYLYCGDADFEVVFIDECSTVSNKDMRDFLAKGMLSSWCWSAMFFRSSRYALVTGLI